MASAIPDTVLTIQDVPQVKGSWYSVINLTNASF